MVHSASGALPPGVYFARVQALNLLGAGPPTRDIAFQAGAGNRIQGPTNLSLGWQGGNAVLTWTPPSGGGPDMPAAYVIEAGSASGSANVASINVGGATSYVTGVPAGTYFVRVRGISASGISDPSNEVVVKGAQVPDAPSNLEASGEGSSVVLSWSAPAGQVSGYVIEAGSAPGRSDVGSLNVGTATAFGTSASPGVYFVRVRAVNAQGVGPASNEIVVKR
jgi:predicted phage tail protein